MVWTVEEDELLIKGFMKYAYNWEKIKGEFLPEKEAYQIKNRYDNQIKTIAGGFIIFNKFI